MRRRSELTGAVIVRCVWYGGLAWDSTRLRGIGGGTCFGVNEDVMWASLLAKGRRCAENGGYYALRMSHHGVCPWRQSRRLLLQLDGRVGDVSEQVQLRRGAH
jgi:hypothetical protein